MSSSLPKTAVMRWWHDKKAHKTKTRLAGTLLWYIQAITYTTLEKVRM